MGCDAMVGERVDVCLRGVRRDGGWARGRVVRLVGGILDYELVGLINQPVNA